MVLLSILLPIGALKLRLCEKERRGGRRGTVLVGTATPNKDRAGREEEEEEEGNPNYNRSCR